MCLYPKLIRNPKYKSSKKEVTMFLKFMIKEQSMYPQRAGNVSNVEKRKPENGESD